MEISLYFVHLNALRQVSVVFRILMEISMYLSLLNYILLIQRHYGQFQRFLVHLEKVKNWEENTLNFLL